MIRVQTFDVIKQTLGEALTYSTIRSSALKCGINPNGLDDQIEAQKKVLEKYVGQWRIAQMDTSRNQTHCMHRTLTRSHARS